MCNRVGRILDTQRLTDEQLVDMEYWEKGDEFEICKARVTVVLRESWYTEESGSDEGW